MNKSKNYEVRNITDMRDLLNQSVNLYGDRNAFLVRSSGSEYTGISYSRFKQDVDCLGTALTGLGLIGMHIAVMSENRYEWCVSYLSTVNGAGVIVPIDKELKQDEVENLLKTSDASAIIYSSKYHECIKSISRKLPDMKFLINMDSDENTDSVLSFQMLLKKGRQMIADGDRSFVDAVIDPYKMSILLFTSGTTGHAKGVMLSHHNICSNITSVRSVVYFDDHDTSLSILPLHHTYECTCGFLTLIYSGSTVAFNEGLKHIGKNLKEAAPSVLILVPLLMESMYRKVWEQAAKKTGGTAILKLAIKLSNTLLNVFNIDIRRELFKKIHDNFGGRLRIIIIGAAAIDPEVSKAFRAFGISVLQGYGLTECSPLVTGNRDSAFVDSSIGLPIPGVEIKINNPDNNGAGEILVKGENVMLGYYNNDNATDNCMKNGWFHTGDIGYYDKDGFYYITGRSKNVIVTKNGKNIFPEEVEAYLNKSPYVQESLVWGKLDERSGETHVTAQILPNLDFIRDKLRLPHVSKEDIMKLLSEAVKSANTHMPLYKHIREFSIRETEFMKTTTQKIKRYAEEMTHKSTYK